MTTKKQKREAALAKREAFLKEEKERGLEAQRRARDEEAIRNNEIRTETLLVGNRLQLILDKYNLSDEFY